MHPWRSRLSTDDSCHVCQCIWTPTSYGEIKWCRCSYVGCFNIEYGSSRWTVGDCGTGKYISGIPLFHALTGCDTVSFFCGRCKKTAWNVWDVYPELPPVLKTLKSLLESVNEECTSLVERFVVLLYDRTSNHAQVNQAILELFAQKSRAPWRYSPAREALLQHVKRPVLQAGDIWGQALLKQPVLPSPWVGMGIRWANVGAKMDNLPPDQGRMPRTYMLWLQDILWGPS